MRARSQVSSGRAANKLRMLKRFLAALLAITAVSFHAPELIAQRNCTRGKPCGSSCIAANLTCRVGTRPRTPSSTAAPTPAASRSRVPPPNAQFVASSRGGVYYPVGCTAWQSLSQVNLTWYVSAEAAEQAGKRMTTDQLCAGSSAPPTAPAAEPAIATASVVPTEAVTSMRPCQIERIVDGDTLECAGSGERIRLLLIDAPEIGQGDYGAIARMTLEQLTPIGVTTYLEGDVKATDRYGRTLSYMYAADGRMVNEELARQGFAVISVYPPNVRYVDRLRAAAAEAQAARRGLWSGSAFECEPSAFRAGTCR